MKRRHFIIGAGAALLSGIAAGQARAAAAGVTIIGLDISDSAPLALSQAIANKVAGTIEAHIRDLPPGHRIRILSMGDSGVAKREIDYRQEIGTKARSKARIVAQDIGARIRSIPGMVKAGKLSQQTSTNLVEFLHSLKSLDCHAEQVNVILVTDGIEWSSRVDGRQIIAGTAKIPAPSGRVLDGCSVDMYGVGQQRGDWNSDGLYDRLEPQWRAFLEEAGASANIFYDFERL
jgi:hypothetical protein